MATTTGMIRGEIVSVTQAEGGVVITARSYADQSATRAIAFEHDDADDRDIFLAASANECAAAILDYAHRRIGQALTITYSRDDSVPTGLHCDAIAYPRAH